MEAPTWLLWVTVIAFLLAATSLDLFVGRSRVVALGALTIIYAAVAFAPLKEMSTNRLTVSIEALGLVLEPERAFEGPFQTVPKVMLTVGMMNLGEPVGVQYFKVTLIHPDGSEAIATRLELPRQYRSFQLNQSEGIDERTSCGPLAKNDTVWGRLFVEWHDMRMPNKFFDAADKTRLRLDVADVRGRIASAEVPLRPLDEDAILPGLKAPRCGAR
jgi:hypothetical protein